MLAGLPKAPSAYNPVANPQRARQRQQYVLRRMRELGHISEQQLAEARQGAPPRAPGSRRFRRRARRIPGRDGAPGDLRAVPGGGLYQGLPRLHHDPQGRPGGGLRGARARAPELRPQPGLPRPGRLSSSCRPNADRGRLSTRRWPSTPTSTTCRRRWCSPRARRRCRPCCRSGETVAVSGDGLRFAARALEDKGRAATAHPARRRRSGCSRTTRRTGRSRSCPRRRRRSSRSTRATARSARWSAASISTATSSTTSRRPGASRARRSSPSSIPRRWRRASRRPP